MVSQFSDGMKEYRLSDEERHFRREYLSLGVPPLQGSSTSFQSYFDVLALAQLAKFTRQASFLNLKPLQNVVIARH